MTMELRDFADIVRARWVSVVAVLLTCLSLAALITLHATPSYSSSATLFVATQDADAAQLYQGGLFAQQRVQSYADVVPKSQELARAVVRSLDAGADSPVSMRTVMSEITATVVPDTVNLVLTATDPDPRRAQAIAQGYARALTTLVGDLETPDGSSGALIHAEVVQDATVDTSPVSPLPARNLAIGLLVGLVLGVSTAIARAFLDTSVSTREDVGDVTDAPVLGHITADVASVETPPQQALAGTSGWAEGFRVLRTNLHYVDPDTDKKLFVVTSSLPQEGKTTTAVSLAVTLAQADVKVALVECDLRRPLIAGRLGLDDAVGTTTVLIGKVRVPDAIQRYGALDVLTCGPIPPNPSELLQSPGMARLLAELRAAYDVVLLDAPPLLPVTDAALLAAQTDGALVVVRHGRTSRDQLAHAVDRLDSVDARALGVVLNMVPTRNLGGASYGDGYRYGYGAPEPARVVEAAPPAPVVVASAPVPARKTAARRPAAKKSATATKAASSSAAQAAPKRARKAATAKTAKKAPADVLAVQPRSGSDTRRSA